MNLRRIHGLAFLIATFGSFAASAYARGDADRDAAALGAIHRDLGPSVVQVDTVVRKQLDNGVDVDLEHSGIGLVVGEKLVMAPSLLFDDSATLGSRVISVTITVAGGERHSAKLRGTHSSSRLAFLDVVSSNFTAKPIAFADDDTLSVGQFIGTLRLAGPSFHYVPYVDAFMVNAALDSPRCYVTTYAVSDYIGGPVVAFDGRVIGIVNRMSLLARPSKIDPVTGQRSLELFADIQGYDENGNEYVIVPYSTFKDVLANPPRDDASTSSKGEKSTRPWVGIEVQPLLSEMAAALELSEDRKGVLITRILPESPAQRAGLRTGDLVFAVDGTPLDVEREGDELKFSAILGAHTIGDRIQFSVMRGIQILDLGVDCSAPPLGSQQADKASYDPFGMSARDVVYSDRADLDLPLDATGARTTVVKRSGFAGQAGLKVGDIIRQVDGESVLGAADLVKKLEERMQSAKKSISLFVTRGADTLFVEVRPRESAR